MTASLISCTFCIWDRAYCFKCQKGFLRSYSDNGSVNTPSICSSGDGDFKDMRDYRTFCRAGGL